jgi:hypothetical protein
LQNFRFSFFSFSFHGSQLHGGTGAATGGVGGGEDNAASAVPALATDWDSTNSILLIWSRKSSLRSTKEVLFYCSKFHDRALLSPIPCTPPKNMKTVFDYLSPPPVHILPEGSLGRVTEGDFIRP